MAILSVDMDEVHAFVVGFFEGFCLCRPRRRVPLTVKKMIDKEYWYYLAGRFAGKVAIPLVVIGVVKLAKEVLL